MFKKKYMNFDQPQFRIQFQCKQNEIILIIKKNVDIEMRVRKPGLSMIIHIFASLTVVEMTSIFVIRFDLCEK